MKSVAKLEDSKQKLVTHLFCSWHVVKNPTHWGGCTYLGGVAGAPGSKAVTSLCLIWGIKDQRYHKVLWVNSVWVSGHWFPGNYSCREPNDLLWLSCMFWEEIKSCHKQMENPACFLRAPSSGHQHFSDPKCDPSLKLECFGFSISVLVHVVPLFGRWRNNSVPGNFFL